MAELARAQARELVGRARDRRAAVLLVRERDQVVLEALAVAQLQPLAVIVERDPQPLQVCARVVERDRPAQLPRAVREAELARPRGRDELERVGLVVAREERPAGARLADRQAELQRVPARGARGRR